VHNNPVRIADAERKILWPEHQIPDLFLSIGTGSSYTLTRVGSEKMAPARKGIISHGRQLLKIMRSNLEQTLDCDRAWDNFISSAVNSLTRSVSPTRFVRINPNVGDIPALDDKDKMDGLRSRVQKLLKNSSEIRDIARRLVASSFYFELLSASDSDEKNGTAHMQGKSATSSGYR
jgi:hypothetical protein